MSTAEVWRRRCMAMRAQRDDARAQVGELRAQIADRDELARTCPHASYGRRHAVRPARAPGAIAAGLVWRQTCHAHFADPRHDRQVVA